MTIPALEALEARVAETAELVTALRERNGELERRVRELEGELAERPAEPDGDASRERERATLRRRVESLAKRLEQLLES